jgi:hypothetical protein
LRKIRKSENWILKEISESSATHEDTKKGIGSLNFCQKE